MQLELAAIKTAVHRIHKALDKHLNLYIDAHGKYVKKKQKKDEQ